MRQSNLWKDAWRRYIRNNRRLSSRAASSCCSSSTASSGRSSRPTTRTRSTSRSRTRVRASTIRSAPTTSAATCSTRTALGGRVSIGIGFAATIVILLIGVAYGSISGFVGGKLDNGMMRLLDTLYGLPYLPFAIITLAIFGNVELLDDGDRALDRQLVHDRPDRARADHHAEGERLRARGEGGRRALVPRARPAPAPEHARRARSSPSSSSCRASSSARRSCPSSASASARPTPRGARWRRRAARSTASRRTSSRSRSIAIATLILCANFIADGLRDALDPRTRET